MLSFGFQLSCGKCVKYGFVEFFLFDYSSLPYLFSLFFWSGVTSSLIAVDKMMSLALVLAFD